MPITPEQYQAMLGRLEKNSGREPELPSHDAAEEELPLQESIIQDARSRGWWVLFSRMDLPTTTPLGTPDLIIFAHGGRVFILEAKSAKGKIRPEQLGIKILLEKLGHVVSIVRSFQDYLRAVDKPN